MNKEARISLTLVEFGRQGNEQLIAGEEFRPCEGDLIVSTRHVFELGNVDSKTLFLQGLQEELGLKMYS